MNIKNFNQFAISNSEEIKGGGFTASASASGNALFVFSYAGVYDIIDDNGNHDLTEVEEATTPSHPVFQPIFSNIFSRFRTYTDRINQSNQPLSSNPTDF